MKLKTGIWIAILAGILIVSLVCSYAFEHNASGSTACIYLDGELVRKIDLSAVSTEYSFTIENENGWNQICVRNGAICVVDADCADHTCVSQGWLKSEVTPIVCLPHRLVIQLENQPVNTPDEDTFDAVAG